MNRSFLNVFVGTAEFRSTCALVLPLASLAVGWFVAPAWAHGAIFSPMGLALTLGSCWIGAKMLAAGGINRTEANLRGKTIVVTGGASGIGMQTVRELARMGGTVILAARGSPERLTAALAEARSDLDLSSGGSIETMNLDLSSFAAIHTFVQEFLSEHTRLHLLINNAGVMMCPYGLTADGLEMQIGTNHFGHFLLTNLLLDTLLASRGARVVNVSSIGHSFGPRLTYPRQNSPQTYDKLEAYGDSKLANIYFSQELERRFGAQGLHAYSLHPGSVATPLARHMPFIVQHLGQLPSLKTPFQGCQTSLHCALSPDAVPGAYHSDCQVWSTSPAAKDEAMAKWLWEESQRVTKIGN